MSDTTSTLTWVLRDQVSAPAAKMGGALDDAGDKADKSGGLLGGLAAKVGGLVNPLTLAVAGGTAFVGFLGMAGKAAADEEKNIEKMRAALEANVPGWDGNTDAIERLISERENLAFSDDELRDSLARLVTSTNDVQAAQDLQATAMDLARLKGVDLMTATEALAKANQGSTRELKALGLAVDDGATKTEILTTIQRAAAGQAQAYASTTSAKWEILQNKFGNIVETVGGAVVPIFEALADFAITTLIPTISKIAELVGPILKGAFDTLVPLVSGLAHVVGPVLGTAFDVLGKAIGWAMDHVIKPAIDLVRTLIGWVKDALKFLGILQDEPIPAVPNSSGSPDERGERAHGGPVEPFTAYSVGEQGRETLVMGSQGGTIIPAGAGSGGFARVELPIIVDGREIARVVDDRLYAALEGAGGSVANR